MSNDTLATILLAGLPYAWGVKAAVFMVLSITLVMQRPQSRLGVVINGLFFATVLTSLWTTWLVTFLIRSTTGDEIDSSVLWGLIILGNILPWIVNALGIAVTYYTYKAEPIETRDARDKRQKTQQDILDETSLVLAERGQMLSNAGINLDERIVHLGEDQRVHDAEGVSQAATDVRQDQREHDADVREGLADQRENDADAREEEGL